ncbi:MULTISPECIES: helix-turn-helix domain-containing protein [unclassified Oceanobacillus]|uniref:helix-turn-helix domain-containing protein n=1 Tax=unclassified Oceanobacillus TaxID=2630292 RepID=UPI00300E220A
MNKETVKLIRWYLKMTQEQFSEHIGVTYSTLAEIESGNRRVSGNVEGKIAHAFNPNDPGFIEFVERHQALKKLGVR